MRLVLSLTATLLAACGPSQECRDYVACQVAYDAEVSVAPYLDDGACWKSTLQTAQACTQQCIDALDALSQVASPPDECL